MSQIVLFYDEAFPFDGNREIANKLASAVVDSARNQVVVVSAERLAEALASPETVSFINLHAPYFPVDTWISILAYARSGRGLISIGGAPFKRPVRQVNGGWHIEPEQTAYHQQLHIHEALAVDCASVISLHSNEDIPLLVGQESLFSISNTWNLVPHVSKTSDLPHQMGSSGPMDTRIYPLLKGVTNDNREISAPVVLWEHVGGPFAGGRWLFINQEPGALLMEQAQALVGWATFCAKGVTELWIKPNYGSYEPGERAVLTLQAQYLGRAIRSQSAQQWNFSIAVGQKGESTEWTSTYAIHVTSEWEATIIPVPATLHEGFYTIICRAQSDDGEVRILRQGFWGVDRQLLASGTSVRAGRDYFERDGRPLPVVGMTYMTSDVARKFLFLPNVQVWDRDMAQMRRAGINWIRTGIWTAYRNIMQVDGHASEEALRAIDAFLLTAAKHELQVTFTFFSFTPETWEGVNPFLDPRSVNAQKRFIRSIVSRHRQTKGVDWDLINEPSLFDPARIFSDGPRSCRDPFEITAYRAWLMERHETIEQLREHWNATPEQLPSFDVIVPPEATEINFDIQDIHLAKKGTRWLDYVLFSMDMHNRWAKQLVDTIKEITPDRLVTVGQDEGLGAQRPSPFFYEDVVDYTTVHSWWLNDQLVWDGVFAKTANKPNLIQETGIMYVETPDGRAKRTEAELRNILERKYAYAFSTGGAGAIHWLWNTNFYMNNANESQIGAVRADGTEKPEANVSYDFGKFIEASRDLFKDRELEQVVVVFPYSNDFSNRQLAFDATTRASRVLAYEIKQSFRAVSEYHLDDLRCNPAKLIIVPSPHNFEDKAITELFEIVRDTGATLLWTGPVGLDAYWHPVNRFEQLLGSRAPANVRREELLEVAGQTYTVSYGARRIAQVAKENVAGGRNELIDVALGAGRIIWCPLPVELNDRYEPVAALYRYAIEQAQCEAEFVWERGGELAGLYGRKLAFKDGSLFIFVSELGSDAEVEVKDPVTGCGYAFTLETDRSVLFAVEASGSLLEVYRPDEVAIQVKR
ncbi:MAG: beta-galactosidase [Candidatus Cohnella colombiensis]|uniref:Beta-galactosidase n=1 Tax=Candidatus Cohnella colombiensis TaxID=3121368 RepID=A0AA95EXH5_9BACL|nr:MAG: beta-galactosidase [Cohnella sp.]